MTHYVLVEMSNGELIGLRVFDDVGEAQSAYDLFCSENTIHDADADDVLREMTGTLAIAGDDSYSVQLVALS